jgi:kynurenine formamidase
MNRTYFGNDINGEPVTVIDLAQPLTSSSPSSPNHPGFRQVLHRRHGDHVRDDGTSGASDLLVMGTHSGTHIDALSHVSHDGHLYGGISAATAQQTGQFTRHGSEELQPTVAPGILLDVARALGVKRLEPGYEITTADLQLARDLVPGNIPIGAALLIRTGWAQLWDDADAFISHQEGVPGPNLQAAHWLVQLRPRLVGSDTTAFEHIRPANGHRELPVHKLVIVNRGLPIVEMMNLETLSDAEALRHTFVLAPLLLVGATGSPVRPIALT